MIKLTVPRDPNSDLNFVLEGGGLILYYDDKILRTVEFEDFYPDAAGEAFVVWERTREYDKLEGDEIKAADGMFYSPRNVQALDYRPMNPDIHPQSTLFNLVRKWYNVVPRNMQRPWVVQLARSRIRQYIQQDGNPEDN